MKTPGKYDLYELAVQSPDSQIEIFYEIYEKLRRKSPRHFREDFCGTFALSAGWLKYDERNTAVGLDLDSEPLAYGRKKHLAKMSSQERRRIKIKKQNVISVTTPKVDLIGACNFSFFIFKERKQLIDYFRACHRSLNATGILVLEMAGGPGMIEPLRERKTIKMANGKKFQYVWHQKSFNPITRDAHYSIHFDLLNGKRLMDAFTYDWRIWTIPEVRDALHDAGFKDICIFWDKTCSDKSSDYVKTEKGANNHAWVAQVVALR